MGSDRKKWDVTALARREQILSFEVRVDAVLNMPSIRSVGLHISRPSITYFRWLEVV